MAFNNTNVPLQTSPLKSPNIIISQEKLPSNNAPLHASKDARELVRLAQCPQCSYILHNPVTLPCGNTLCEKCIPKMHTRPNLSYLATTNRLQGFICPWTTCEKEHAEGDCSINVVLSKIIDAVGGEIQRHRNESEASEVLVQIEELDNWSVAGVTSLRDEESQTRIYPGGKITATYTMAGLGELKYGSEVAYRMFSSTPDECELMDTSLLERLKESTASELDCQVCYGLFLDPLTTSCGHSFCRTCLHRVMDHTNLCPVCRRTLSLPPVATSEQGPTNILLEKLLTGLYPESVATRAHAVANENRNGTGEFDTPLFVCTLSLPTQPTFLYIFEPRYRLMIRRAMESGDRKFGMVLYNPQKVPQGELGSVDFYEYGTLLNILDYQPVADGRSVIQTVGISRFRVLRHAYLDGYMVGKVERVVDIGIAEEEALEISETTSTNTARTLSAEDQSDAPPHHASPSSPQNMRDLDTMSTQDLMQFNLSFIKKMARESTPQVQAQVLNAFGPRPEDPALFPWWFATVIPVDENEKYQLLRTTSVRGRLKLCAGWVMGIEAQSWYANSF